MTVFAIDPGPHTGIFYIKNNEPHFALLDFRNETTPHKNLYMWLMQMVDPLKDRVICESFEFRKEDAQNRSYIDYSTGELVGTVALFCQLTGTAHTRQMAAQGKGFWNDDKLKRVGLWIGGPDAKHLRDAARHWLHFITFQQSPPDQSWFYKLKKR